jgi:hypothetical protein
MILSRWTELCFTAWTGRIIAECIPYGNASSVCSEAYLHTGNNAKIETDVDCKICLNNKERRLEIAVPDHATKMEAFQLEKTSFQIESFDSEKLSIRVTNVHKAINTELLLWPERDSTYSVYVPEAQSTHQAAMAMAEILRANANSLFPYKISGTGSYLTLLNRVAHEIARGTILVNWALERMKIPQFQKPDDELYADLASETFRALDREDYNKRFTAGPIANLMVERKISRKEAGAKMAKRYGNLTRAERDSLLRCALLESLGIEIAKRQRTDVAQNRPPTDPVAFMKTFIPDVHPIEAQSATDRGWLALR